MKSPILNSITHSISRQSPPIFHFTSLSRFNNRLLYIPHPKLRSSTIRFAGASSSLTSNCRGWDDCRQLSSDWSSSGESYEIRDFVGIIDKRYGLTFLLGVVFALAFSRVKVSYIALVPASAVVFAAGFGFGFGGFDLVDVGRGKRKGKESSARVYNEGMIAVEEFLNEFEVKVSELKKSLLGAIESKEIRMDELERYVDVIEAMQASALNTRNAIDAEIDGAKLDNRKLLSRRSKKIGEIGSEMVQFVGGMFGGRKGASSKASKVKENDNPKQVATISLSSDRGPGIEEGAKKDVSDSKSSSHGSVSSQDGSSKYALDWDEERRIRIVSESSEMDPDVVVEGGKRFTGREESYNHSNSRVSWKIDESDEADTWRPSDSMQEHGSSDARDMSFEDSKGAYGSSRRKRNDGEMFSSRYREERLNDELHLLEDEQDPGGSYSSKFSDDAAFNRYLTEANNLLKEAKDCIRGRSDEEHAEVMLYKSAKLLSKAIALKPMSLLAVGQLGNTYLLHGELKLKISRELRATLSTWGPLSFENQGSIRGELRRKDKLVEVLTGVCEECEELLVEAGRRYRLALSIDGDDVRALYNWGLALTFRAQLIADIGPEAAFDADKLFLAATDKFDAMMSKSNVHAPDALFKWGVVLQQRSRLRPPNSRQKVKLLEQARRLYEDALHMDSDNVQVRDALLSCTSELSRRSLRSF
ncbi:hypothetical protein LINPERPRIM_LOCUS4596 [Linum perenne]